MNDIVLVIGGFDAMAAALETNGQFKEVLTINTTSELRDLITTKLKDRKKSELVFLFADSMTVDTPQNLQFLCDKLQARRWRVALMERSGTASAMVRANPELGLIQGPHNLNKTLGALMGMEGMPALESAGNAGFAALDDQQRASTNNAGTAMEPANTSETPKPSSDRPIPGAAKPGQKPEGRTGPSRRGGGKPPAKPAPAPGPKQAENAAALWGEPATKPARSEPPSWDAASNKPTALEQPVSGNAATTASDESATRDAWNDIRSADAWVAATPAEPAPAVPSAVPGAAPGAASSGPAGRRRTLSAMVAASERGQLTQPARRGRMIVVTAPKGGTGKSTVSINLAAYLGLRLQGTGKTVALVDSNFQQADTGKYLNTFRPNIRQLAGVQLTEQSIRQHLVERPEWNLSILLGPSTPIEAAPAIMNGKLYTDVTNHMRSMFDYIIVDTPVAETYHDIFDNFVLKQADYVIVTVTPNMVTLLNTDLWLRTITSPGHAGGRDFDAEKVGFILNQAEEGIDCDEDTVRTELSNWSYLGAIPSSKEWKRAANSNQIVCDKNYADINGPLGRILYGATGEEVLRVQKVAEQKPKRWWQRR